MFESIAINLISTLISFLFEQNILKQNHTDIQGAPFWYEKKYNQNRIYVSTYYDGDLDSIDKAKNKAIEKITIIIEDAYKVTIKKEFLKSRSKKELVFIKAMGDDSNLLAFVKEVIVFQDIEYNKKIQRSFVRAYIDLKVLKQYQTQRIIKIKKEVLDYQFDYMMEELEEETL